MPKKALELSPLAVSRISKPGFHFVGGVAGLALQVLPSGGRSWVLRVSVGTRRRDMGLGGFPDVTLADAREAARVARAKVRAGIDPIEEARSARARLKLAQANAVTFERASLTYIDKVESAYRRGGVFEKRAVMMREWAAFLAKPETDATVIPMQSKRAGAIRAPISYRHKPSCTLQCKSLH